MPSPRRRAWLWRVLLIAALVFVATGGWLGWQAWQVTADVGAWSATGTRIEHPDARRDCGRLFDQTGAAVARSGEQRGPFRLYAVTLPDGAVGMCLARDGPGPDHRDRRRIDAVALTEDGVPPAAMFVHMAEQQYRGGWVRVVYGRVPTTVSTVVVQTSTFGAVTAPATDGWFATWWPMRRVEKVVALDRDPDIELRYADGHTSTGLLSQVGTFATR